MLWSCILECLIYFFTPILFFSTFYIAFPHYIAHTFYTNFRHFSAKRQFTIVYVGYRCGKEHVCAHVCICCANDDVDLCPSFADNVQTFFVFLLLPLLVTGSLWGPPLLKRTTPPPPSLVSQS